MNNNINLFITQRHELINELVALTKDKFYRIIYDIYQAAKSKNKVRDYIVRDFQLELKQVSQWDVNDIKERSLLFKQAQDHTLCNDEEILAKEGSCFAHVLQGIHSLNQRLFPSEVSLLEPTNDFDLVDNFVKICTLNIAREVWKKAFLFYEVIDRRNVSQYNDQIEKIIVSAIKMTIRRQSSIEPIYKAILNLRIDAGNMQSVAIQHECYEEGKDNEDDTYDENARNTNEADDVESTRTHDTKDMLHGFLKEHNVCTDNVDIGSIEHSFDNFENVQDRKSIASSVKSKKSVDVMSQNQRTPYSSRSSSSSYSESEYDTMSDSEYSSSQSSYSDVPSTSSSSTLSSVSVQEVEKRIKNKLLSRKKKHEMIHKKSRIYNDYQRNLYRNVSDLLNAKSKIRLQKQLEHKNKKPAFF